MTANRFPILIVAAVIAALAVLTLSMVPHQLQPISGVDSYAQIEMDRAARYEAAAAQQAYLDQRRGEQTTPQYVDPQQVLQDFRHSEQTTGHVYDAQQANLTYREGEWYGGLSPAQADLNYRRGEWTGQ